jgi:hypothetical protein
MDRRATARRRDAGSGPVTALLCLAIVALLVGAGFTALGAAAGDESSTAQHAADAAALGGARSVLDDVPEALDHGFTKTSDIADLLGGGSCLQTGRVKAAQLAAANGATLTSYCWNVFRDRVSATVRMNSTNVSGPPAGADAEAATTFDASSCALDPGFEPPSPSPSPTGSSDPPPSPAPTEPPAPPRPVTTWVDCGSGRLNLRFDPSDLRFTFQHLGRSIDDLKPRLTA